MLAGRTIVLGVSGGIAAYKAVEVCRRLVDAGAHVVPVHDRRVPRASSARSPSRRWPPSRCRPRCGPSADPIPHTRLGQRADLVVVCPATARLIGDYAAGISHDLLTATLLATRAPVVVCPAMHTEMWEHPAVQENLATLRRRGVIVVDPGRGRLAGGDVGAGRLADPADIVGGRRRAARSPRPVADLDGPARPGHRRGHPRGHRPGAGHHQPLVGQAGLRRWPSGPQARGAKVTLVTTVDRPVPAGIEVVEVASAADMEAAVVPRSGDADVIVMAAAVADFRPGGRGRPQDQEGRRPARDRARAHPRLPGRPRRGASRPARPWSASRPRPTTWWPTPATSCSARASTSSWPTTCRRPGPASSTTPTRS